MQTYILFVLLLIAEVSVLSLSVIYSMRYLQRNSFKWYLLIIPLMNFIPLVALGLTISTVFWLDYPQQKFNQQYWASRPEKRYTMEEDLIETKRLIGLTNGQVRQTLGEPSYVDSVATDKLVYTYIIGYPPSLETMDRPQILSVKMKAGLVVEVH